MRSAERRNRLHIFPFLVGLFFLVCPGYPLHAGTSEGQAPIPWEQLRKILVQVETNLGTINTLKTKLIQEKNIALFSEPVISEGVLLFKSPDNIRLEFFQPFQSVLLVSGNDLSKFEMFNGKWKRMDSGSKKMMQIVLDHIGAWIKGQFNRDNLYQISGRYRNPDTAQGYAIRLEPRAKEFKKFIQAFELGINRAMDRLDYIIIRESETDYTRINFSQDLLNTPLEDRYFMGDDNQPLSPAPQW